MKGRIHTENVFLVVLVFYSNAVQTRGPSLMRMVLILSGQLCCPACEATGLATE